MSVNLTIEDEKYKIKIGAEVYSLEYPSFKEAQIISREFQEIGKDGDKAIEKMKEWLVKLGLDERFFDLGAIKARHIMKIWEDVNSVKK